MTRIPVYDDTAQMLQQKADELGVSVAALVDALMDFINEVDA